MKSTGIVRKMDELGRVVLPIELRRTLGINEKDPVEIFLDDDQVVLKKYKASEDKKDALEYLEGIKKHAIHEEEKERIQNIIDYVK